MPAKRREIAIRFVTDSEKLSAIIDTILPLAEDLSVTWKVLGRTTRRVAVKNGSGMLTKAQPAIADEEKPGRPQLVYAADVGAAHRRRIDVEASLKKLGLERQELISRTWPRGSAEHRLKRAAASKLTNGTP